MSSSVAVAELMATFGMGLLALIPAAERSGIAWNGPAVYDPCEDIERALFTSLVESVAENATDGPFRPLPAYGLRREAYGDVSFLTDRSARLRRQGLVFLDLATSSEPFGRGRERAIST